MKPAHTTVPTAFAFDRLGGAPLGANLPIQSSTYRSAQESAPHLLHPQFSLLPSSVNSSQTASQPFGAPIFSSSLERALQRECSVIKHHQRPSSTQPVQQHQLSGSTHHSLLGYLPDDNGISFEESSRHTPVPNNANGVSNGTAIEKAASISQDKFNTTSLHFSEGVDQEMSSHKQQTRYDQKQSSVIASHSQSYTPEQLSSLASIRSPQTYITCQSLSNLSESQSFLSSQPVYKTLPSMASVSQSLVYSSDQEHIVSPAANKEVYDRQVQALCMSSLSQNYSSTQCHSLPDITSRSYTPSPHFSPTQQQSLPSDNSTQVFTQMQHFPVTKSDGLILEQPQKYLSTVQTSTSSTATYTQALKDSQSSLEQKTAFNKQEQEENKFLSSKYRHGELPIQEVQALQQASIEMSAQNLADKYVCSNSSAVYAVSKIEDNHVQSVIRSNSRLEDQVKQISSIKNERTSSLHENNQLISNASPAITSSPEDSTLMESSHVALNADQPKEASVPLKDSTVQQDSQQQPTNPVLEQTQFVRLSNAQVLRDPSQMILFQQAVLQQAPGSSQSKPVVQIQPVSFQFLPVSGDVLNSALTIRENQQLAHQVVESVKQPLVQKDSFSSSAHIHDPKQPFSLSSICFPESIMMADERSILSNVEDILAATAAACGVTPQDFKTSEGQLASVSNPVDSKCQFQLVGTDSFNSQHLGTNSQTLTLNGCQLTTNLDREVDGQRRVPTANSQSQVHSEKSHDSSLNCNDSGLNPTNQNHSDLHSTGLEMQTNQPNAVQNVKMEEDRMGCSSAVLCKKKNGSKTNSKQAGEDQNVQPKSQKRSSQVKRQNLKSSEISPSSDDGSQQQERIRQKIKEVEEKQPEVKSGFIGSFLDFLKSGPKQHFTAPPIRSPNRTKKPPVPKTPLLVSPQTVQPATPVVSPDINSVGCDKKDDEFEKNLETLPTFSSDEEESVGRNKDLQKRISSALSSLDESSDKKRSGAYTHLLFFFTQVLDTHRNI